MRPFSKLAPLLVVLISFASAQTHTDASVTRVIDGDTVVLAVDGVPERVRLIGVDTPEVRGRELYAAEATAYAEELLTGQRVKLERDVQERDRFDRLLAYLFLPDGRQVNLLIAEAGLAKLQTVPPNTRYEPLYAAAIEGARSVRKGLWSGLPGGFKDRDCKDFTTRREAQAFFQGAQPGDRHRLDPNKDGKACTALPE